MHRFHKLILCLAAAVSLAWGQGAVGTLNGTVLDNTGAVIPGAVVVATNNATSVEHRATTTSAGAYTLPYLPAGTYTVKVTAPGFRVATAENVILRVGQTLTVNITMELGAVTEQVTVSAAPPLLESGTAEIGRYISTEEYKNWPIIVSDGNRQIQDFIFRSLPGAVGGTFRGAINGGQAYSHEILIEGIPLGRSDLSGGNNNEMTASAEAISEFKLHTGAMGAQYNGGQTAVANFSVKSGTNDLHGSAYYYGQNNALNANTLANNARGLKKSPFKQHNYGFSVGGPVYIPKVYNGKNKTFFYSNIEWTEYSQFNIAGLDTTLPTTDFKKGDFSRLLNPAFTGQARSGTAAGQDASGRSVLFGQIFDPASTRRAPNGSVIRDPFPNNVIPQNRLNPVSRNVVEKVGIIDPDLDRMIRNKAAIGTCCPFFDLRIYTFKGDHQIGDRHRLSGLYNHEYRLRNNSPGGRYLPVPGIPTQTFQNQYTPSRMVRLSLDSTVTPTLLNRIAAGYNRFRNSNESVYVDQDWASKIGVKNTSKSHFPSMRFGGNEWQGGSIHQIGSSSAGEGVNGSWIAQDDVTILSGAHSFRVGYEYRNYFYNTRSKSGSGIFNFRPDQTWMPGFSTETGNAFASFMLGAVSSAGRGIVTLSQGNRHPAHAFYFTDDWKVTPNLTLNLGLRWEVVGAFSEVTDRMSMIDLNAANPGAEGRKGALFFGDRFQDTYWKQFGPRFGFAYRLNQKTVVRGGYGITNTPPIANNWGYGGFSFGFNGNIPVIAGTGPTGFVDDPAMYLDQPYPDFRGTLPNKDPAAANFTGGTTTARDSNRTAYAQNWNFTFQYELPAMTVLEVAYIGNKGTRLWAPQYGNLNALPASFLSLGDVLRERAGSYPQFKPYPSFPDNQTVAQALKPYPQFTGMSEAFPYYANSNYNSLQVTATRHLTKGLGILAAYTWSKTIGYEDANGPDAYPWLSQDPYNRALDRSVAGFDVPHQFKFTWVYEIPVGKGKPADLGWLNYPLGGWKFSGAHQYASGSPINIGQSGINNVLGTGTIRPDVVSPNMTLGGAPDKVDFFNPTPFLNPVAFAPSPRTGNGVPLRLGTAPRYLAGVRGPHRASEDFRMSKIFPIWERINFELGATFINAFNRSGRGFASTDVTSVNFGRLVAGGGGRSIELSGRIEW